MRRRSFQTARGDFCLRILSGVVPCNSVGDALADQLRRKEKAVEFIWQLELSWKAVAMHFEPQPFFIPGRAELAY